MPRKSSRKHTRYLIVGNSAGGIGAVEAIREVDADRSITIVSDEPYPAYSRPEISEYLAGLTTVERMLFRPPDFYEKNGVEAILGVAAIRVDLRKRHLELDNGRTFAWDRLLLATGGRPAAPRIPGAAPKVIRDNVGIPIELAIASVDTRLRQEGIRNQVSLIAAGGFRGSADIVKAIALGADAVYIGTAALVALGCTVCQQCHTGRCAWDICTTDPALSKRVNPEIGARRLVNLLRGWALEIKDMLGGMGINAVESLRGNRDHLRGLGLTDSELEVLGVRLAGT